jgi:putative tryptophan/tyrosine transport system substrate-binding protein
MRRRDFIASLGGAAALPFAARAQQAMPVVGLIYSGTAAASVANVNAIRGGLKESGFIEGSNVALELRWGDNRPDRLPALVAELVSRPVAVIVGNVLAVGAAKAATSTIPIVFGLSNDPVADNFVASYNRPGGNITGVAFLSAGLGGKRFELLREVVPKATTIAVLMNPEMATTIADRDEVRAAAQKMGQQVVMVDVANEGDLEPAFASLVERGAKALLVGGGPFMFSNRERIVALATRYKLPASYALREYAMAGGLMSYGNSITDAWRQAGVYAGRILKGEKPADMPVMQSNKFEFVINLKTAKTLGIEIHPQLLATADEVIE